MKDVVVDVHVLVDVAVDQFCRIRFRSSPLKGPAIGKSPALPEDRYCCSHKAFGYERGSLEKLGAPGVYGSGYGIRSRVIAPLGMHEIIAACLAVGVR